MPSHSQTNVFEIPDFGHKNPQDLIIKPDISQLSDLAAGDTTVRSTPTKATGVFSWVNRREWGWIWVRDPSDGSRKRVKHLGRVSNAYVFRDPLPCADRPKAENPAESGTDILKSLAKAATPPYDPLEIALSKLGGGIYTG